MKYFTLHRILASLNLLALIILAIDDYLIPPIHRIERYASMSSVETRSLRVSSHFSYFIHTASGAQFQLPARWEDSKIEYTTGDTFYLDVSRMFRRPVRMYYPVRGNFYKVDLGILNDGYWGKAMIWYIMIVSLIQLSPWRMIRGENLNERLIFSGSTILLVLLFFYFYQ